MTTMQFIASLVGSLAWPLGVVTIAVIFRDQIRRLLTRPVSGVRVGPFEMKWDLERVEVAASVGPQPVGASDVGVAPATSVIEMVGSTVTTSPIGAVLEAHAAIERELRDLVARAVPDASVARAPIRQLLRIAIDHGLISPETVNALEGITVMRNLAAHGQASDVTPERAQDYLALAEAVLYTLRQKPRP
jgi:hypothetical protein